MEEGDIESQQTTETSELGDENEIEKEKIVEESENQVDILPEKSFEHLDDPNTNYAYIPCKPSSIASFFYHHPKILNSLDQIVSISNPLVFIQILILMNIILYLIRISDVAFPALIIIFLLSWYWFDSFFINLAEIIYYALFYTKQEEKKPNNEEKKEIQDEEVNPEDIYNKKIENLALYFARKLFIPLTKVYNIIYTLYSDASIYGEIFWFTIVFSCFLITYKLDFYLIFSILLNIILVLPGFTFNKALNEFITTFQQSRSNQLLYTQK